MIYKINFKKSILICIFLIMIPFAKLSPLFTNETEYWIQREELVQSDINLMIGHDIVLSAEEENVNDILMAYKNQEMTDGFTTLDFFPAKHFFDAKPLIDQSQVFKIIQRMPKGALLHIHDTAMTSIDWVVSELTYWDDLYMCNTTGILNFMFFNEPDSSCSWVLVSAARAMASSPEEFDALIYSQLSLYTPNYQETYPDINSVWTAFEHVFTSINGIVSYYKAWDSYLARALQELVNDNVAYLEFRGVLPLLYDKDGRIFTDVETFAVYSSVIKNFTAINSDKFFGARYVYAPPRLVDVQQVYEYIDEVIRLKKLFPVIIAGFDLVGQEDLGQPLTAFIEPLLTLTEVDPPIPFFFHAGETDWEGMSSDGNIYDALLLNTTRIGHGYAITKHPKLIELAIQKGVPIEVCPVSNQVLKLVDDLRNHPAGALAASSFPIVVASDDPAIWEALPLSHDFYEFFMGLGGANADLKFLKKLALNSIQYSSLESDEKQLLESLWESQWNDFITSFIINSTVHETDKSNEIPYFKSESNFL